jgi:pimeloyl-ACP methyl ester carboxylesterase
MVSMDVKDFERKRLALFKHNSFEGKSRWVSDRKGRRAYLIERGEGHSPAILVHGGLSEASEWSLLAGKLKGHMIIPDRSGCGLSYPFDYLGVGYGEMAKLQIPTLILWGDRDAFAQLLRGQEAADRMPNAHFKALPGLGHVPYLDRPETVATAINEFIT